MKELISFTRCLGETIGYCLLAKKPASAADVFRTPGLMPFAGSPAQGDAWPFHFSNHRTPVENVIKARRNILGNCAKENKVGVEAIDLSGGRLLYYVPGAYVPYDQVVDEACQMESEGFFDEHNTPPWDTWVAYMTTWSKEDFFTGKEKMDSLLAISFVVSFIPKPYLSVVQRGMDVSAVRNLRWADEYDCALTGELQRAAIVK